MQEPGHGQAAAFDEHAAQTLISQVLEDGGRFEARRGLQPVHAHMGGQRCGHRRVGADQPQCPAPWVGEDLGRQRDARMWIDDDARGVSEQIVRQDGPTV